MYRFFARTRFHLLDQFQHALPCLSLSNGGKQLSERTMLHYFRESVNPKRYFLKRNVRARIVIFFLKSGRMKKKNVDHPINSRRERNCLSWHGEVSFLQTRGYYKFPLIRTVVNGFMTYKRGDATSCSKKRKIYDIDARLSRPFHGPLHPSLSVALVAWWRVRHAAVSFDGSRARSVNLAPLPRGQCRGHATWNAFHHQPTPRARERSPLTVVRDPRYPSPPSLLSFLSSPPLFLESIHHRSRKTFLPNFL